MLIDLNARLTGYLERGEPTPLRSALSKLDLEEISRLFDEIDAYDAAAVLRLIQPAAAVPASRHVQWKPPSHRISLSAFNWEPEAMNPGCGDIVPRIEIARPLHMDSVAGSWRLHLKKTDLPDAAPSVYVVDEEGRLRGCVPLVRLALADPAVRLREILESVDYHLVRDTPALTVLRCMDDGAWDELSRRRFRGALLGSCLSQASAHELADRWH